MAVRLAARMQHLRASEIREILKVTQRPEVISFAGGLPAPEFFPVEEMITLSRDVLEKDADTALQYSTTEGHPPLRAAIADRMNTKRGTNVTADEILVITGSQQGLDLSGKIFIDEGDLILCECPTYLGAINAFKAYGPRFQEVPTDSDGMIIEELEKLLRNGANPKFIYTIPDFQNPTGRTWSLTRRQQFMEVVTRYGVPVIEDAPYTELRFEGEPLPPFKSMDPEGLVIYLGTFSKIFCPGLRIGWVAAPKPLRDKYVLVKQGADLHSSSRSQIEIAEYLARYDIEPRLKRLRETYRAHRSAMIGAMEQLFPPGVTFSRPQGGMFLWVELPPQINARDLLVAALKRDVAFVPGGPFFPNGGHENTMRLSYSNMPEARIKEGIERLAAVIKEFS